MPPDCTITNGLSIAGLDGLDAAVPHLSEYFGLWSILEDPFRAAVGRVNGLDLTVHVQQQKAQSVQPTVKAASGVRDYQVTDQGVAVVSISGPMMKHLSSLSDGTSTIWARRQIRLAAADEQVRAIVLQIDSPGGTVSGTFDLADDVAAAAKEKPVTAYIEDLGASAAYAVASQATKIYANRTALIGAIGTYGVIVDQSKRAEKMGVKVHVVRAGELKGAGEPGTEVTPAQLAAWQRRVDEMNEHFLAAVAAGRRMSLQRVRELADGDVHVGEAAVKLGLIDGVQSLDETISQLFSSKTTNQKVRSQEIMAEPNTADQAVAPAAETVTTPQPAAATLQEIKGACTGADNDFLVEQLGNDATLDQARSAWMAEQDRRLKAQQEELEKQKAAAKRPGFDIPGEGGTKAHGESSGDAVERFDAAVQAKMTVGADRQKAVAAVARENPELHKEFIQATNEGRGLAVSRQIDEKFG